MLSGGRPCWRLLRRAVAGVNRRRCLHGVARRSGPDRGHGPRRVSRRQPADRGPHLRRRLLPSEDRNRTHPEPCTPATPPGPWPPWTSGDQTGQPERTTHPRRRSPPVGPRIQSRPTTLMPKISCGTTLRTNLQLALCAPEDHSFCPFGTHRSPCRSARSESAPGSEKPCAKTYSPEAILARNRRSRSASPSNEWHECCDRWQACTCRGWTRDA